MNDNCGNVCISFQSAETSRTIYPYSIFRRGNDKKNAQIYVFIFYVYNSNMIYCNIYIYVCMNIHTNIALQVFSSGSTVKNSPKMQETQE